MVLVLLEDMVSHVGIIVPVIVSRSIRIRILDSRNCMLWFCNVNMVYL